MNYSTIKNCDIANGYGVRVSIFVSGCTNHCKECFQPETWNFDYGVPFDQSTIDNILKLMSESYIEGLTILGGEPMEPLNQSEVLHLIREVKKKYPEKSIWIYSGFTYEDITNPYKYPYVKDILYEILKNIDVLVDGRFVRELHDPSLKFRGSSNQRIIDIKRTLSLGRVVEIDYKDRECSK